MKSFTNSAAPYAIIGSLMLTITLTCGCSTRGRLGVEWSKMLREEQIQPVFPPREDIRPGDIFLSNHNPNDLKLSKQGSYLPIGIFMDAIDTTEALSQRYAGRQRHKGFHLLDAITNDPPTKMAKSETTNGPAAEALTPLLRDVSFPEFSYAKSKEGAFDAAVPLEGLSTKLGMRASSLKSVDIKIKDAVSQTLPAVELHRRFVEQLEIEPLEAKELARSNDRLSRRVVKSPSYAGLLHVFLAGDTNKSVWITVVTEVFYANAIDIRLTSAKHLKADFSLKPQVLSIDTGGMVSFVGASNDQIGLRKTFNHPHAVGTRGLVYEVKEVEGVIVVLDVNTESGVAPKTTPTLR